MQTCADVNISSMVSPDYILKRFIVLGQLGISFGGIILKVLDTETNEVVALKSQVIVADRLDAGLTEIKVGCVLFPTKAFTNSIIMPIFWTITTDHIFLDGTRSSLPNWFNQYRSMGKTYGDIRFSKRVSLRGLIFTMPIMDYTLKDKYDTLTPDEKRDILFELIVALQALKNINVSHNDLTSTNILLKQTPELRSYTVNGIQLRDGSFAPIHSGASLHYIVSSQYMPVIIDFGQANIMTGVRKSQEYFVSDWIHIKNIFNRFIPYDMGKLLEDARFSVLLHKFFHPLRTRSVKPESQIRIFAPLMEF